MNERGEHCSLKVSTLPCVFEGHIQHLRYCWTKFSDFQGRLTPKAYFSRGLSKTGSKVLKSLSVFKHLPQKVSILYVFLKVPFRNCDTVAQNFAISKDVSGKTPTFKAALKI